MATRALAVAYSGGRDSTALLHATLHAAADAGVRVIALHVHHGLSPNADEWLAHCTVQCTRWARRGLPIEFAAHRLTAAPSAGESVEAWARQARYQALRAMALAHGAGHVLLAHHRRDQAETFLLQALRGAGVAGLAGMPRQVDRDGIVWQRPWLGKSRDEIDAYLRRHRLASIDDESNADPRFARNRLRLQVWPALAGAFEAAESTLATSAAWAQEAQALLDEVAALDLEELTVGEDLQLGPWRAFSQARRSNSLRAWLKARSAVAAPASLVARLLDELPSARSGSCWSLEAAEVRLYRGVLRHEPFPARALPMPGDPEPLHVDAAGRYPLPGWRGVLHVEPVREGGVPLAWLARLDLRARAGREQFQSGPGRPPRSLKKQFQEAGVPEWARGGPLFFSGGQLVFVPGLGLDARVIGLPGQPLVTLRWVAGAHGEAAGAAPGRAG